MGENGQYFVREAKPLQDKTVGSMSWDDALTNSFSAVT
jgi:hypothetical protein